MFFVVFFVRREQLHIRSSSSIVVRGLIIKAYIKHIHGTLAVQCHLIVKSGLTIGADNLDLPFVVGVQDRCDLDIYRKTSYPRAYESWIPYRNSMGVAVQCVIGPQPRKEKNRHTCLGSSPNCPSAKDKYVRGMWWRNMEPELLWNEVQTR